ncbi:envelope stress response membrane protein PspB [Vibrio parahaemolyticus]|uniref:Envelope stress response membrane protein PspB n=1 Tax=Vibrio parahaemolyticus TaxID=670 RepID=A0A4S3TEN0_VIBPH|nr:MULTISPECIES: envelope stress response membrane protein PspB [Vibrio]EJG0762925.1 envelope stress response membrane protein PspB [Vibrio parahaemolyticus O5:K30]EJG0872477.1 envelope stress response membrane protein PspB [Vibrio parahaemolyticus O3]EJG0901135.1 envelope stress response membrane protein PspB [Vibrio parahaemolyticus O3:K56]EJG0938704.1 envelope stress response membrane protein PspB [Vibrio parahaemolyticus O1]EJG0948117.1 envelope stress response membrane protein PspB [Vibri
MSAFLLVGPVIVFLIFVAPLWLFLHYRSKRKTDSALSSQDLERLQVLSEKAEAMQSRVDTLERILDAESPTWRRKYE